MRDLVIFENIVDVIKISQIAADESNFLLIHFVQQQIDAMPAFL